MALPDPIPVRYTEEEAGYVSFRPVVRQTFRFSELLDMVVSVTGKDPARVQQILHSGTVVFHFYRYWWQGFEASPQELAPVLAAFPDSDPSRPFQPESCTKVLIESGATPPRPAAEFDRAAISQRPFWRRRSFWSTLLAEGAAASIAYQNYSYAYHADLYRLDLSGGAGERLSAAAATLAPRNLRKNLQVVRDAARILFVCPRSKPN